MMSTSVRSIIFVSALLSEAVCAQRAPRAGDQVVPPGGQISAAARIGESRVVTPDQLAPVRAEAEQADLRDAQLTTTRRSADASPSLSKPSDGRTQTLVRIEGDDRCDGPAHDARNPTCSRPIETRAADFNRPKSAVLSPEQRLLVDQKLREAPGTAANAARRIGGNTVDADARDAQAVASVVLLPPTAASLPTTDVDAALGSASQDAAVTAVIQAIVTGGPR